jgi:hypothetical protein
VRIAFFGDVVGRPGRRAVEKFIPLVREKFGCEIMIANVENAAGGIGITEKAYRELSGAGLHFMTTGNHVWDKKEGVAILDRMSDIVRPANYPPSAPGRGFGFVETKEYRIAVLNIQGRVFMPPIDCPFRTADACLESISKEADIIVVDFHGEATSEKIAMGWHLDGKVSLLVGTHTHVPTCDHRLLPGGTGYVTDIGMTGAYDSVLGVQKDAVLDRFITMRPVRFSVARKDVRSDILIAEIDESSGRTVSLKHTQMKMEE